jgi:hypothetical protein
MEQVLEVYKRPYDAKHPVVCMDEQPKQLIRESRPSVPMSRGEICKVDYEYIREGTCQIWMFVEPLGNWRSVRVSERKTAIDWAGQVKALVDDPRFESAERITLVCDNLNTHKLGSLYETFPPAEAMRIARKLEIVHTPKHGSWLNVAESELSVLTRQCLSGHIGASATVQEQAQEWTKQRNAEQKGVRWQFTTEQARIRLYSLYPKIIS